MEGTIGEIRIFAGNFAPRNWAFCNGNLLAISSNTALFNILGTIYGGDGRTTFALPDLRSRVAVSPGTGPGLSTYNLGERGGVEDVTLTTNQIPSHNHGLNGLTEGGDSGVPTDNFLASTGARDPDYKDSGTTTNLHTNSIGNTGGSQAHPNIQPYLAINYIICLTGFFPSRS